MLFGALLKENIRVSVMSVRTNLLRTILTVLIIAFGIMALVGILTAIDSIKAYDHQTVCHHGCQYIYR